jgi:hypothetical protein
MLCPADLQEEAWLHSQAIWHDGTMVSLYFSQKKKVVSLARLPADSLGLSGVY